ncbi:glycoside hydrolase family 2 protein [Paenibacillus enshidis]|uniref:Beta-mannosidase B n=1 Tax=Paenibacillus enshidis TaxID=1458439 RepID=A0ABV5AQK7_9BACL
MEKWTQRLDGWRFKASADQEWLPAQVPGCVHTDLLRCGKIPDPFYGTNERELQWIDKQDWEYEANFAIPSAAMALQQLELVCDGLDTYADVSVNGVLVFSGDNMFRTWRYNIQPFVHAGDNVIHIRFRSPIQEDLSKLEKLGYGLPASNDQSELGGLGDRKLSVFARKAPYHYGWDWGPRFVTSGIWREIRLEGWSVCRIPDLFIRQDEVQAKEAKLTALVEIEAPEAGFAQLRLTADGQEWSSQAELKKGVQTVEIPLTIADPKLWWSRGLGEQHLYDFRAELLLEGQAIAERSVRTGLRSIRLVREKDDKGASFYFELNGVPVFAKGANHIPNDSFITEVTAERYRHEVASAAESGMNMLRVWGGGIYEEDVFYELCDEYGILVWQDFMFACSMYPGDEAFLNSVRLEAEDNVRRLRNHPSIALWCGNNEIDAAWAQYNEQGGWGWKKDYTPEQRERIWADYEAIFHRVLPEAVERFAPGSDYWPSSPLIALTGDAGQHAHSSSAEGDIHYWGVWHAVEPFENYNVYVGRFMSEYGFQSFPEYRSVRSYAEEHELELESETMLAHQKNGAGNQLIKQYMDMYLQEPKDFKAFLHMSQILQADAMEMAIEAHRRSKPYCMGSLYWQMNDCWPVASWAGIDYFGRWKALQYRVKRSMSDVLLSVAGHTKGIVSFHVVNDSLQTVKGKLNVSVLHILGGTVKQVEQDVQVDPNGSEMVLTLGVEELLAGKNPGEHMLVVSLEDEQGETKAVREHYFAGIKDMALPVPRIECRESGEGGRWTITLTSDVLARHVWLSAEQEGIFTDNDFDLIPGIPKTIGFLTAGGDSPYFRPHAPRQVTVRSIMDYIKQTAAQP